MGTTWFKRLENRSQSTIKLLNIEDSNSRGHNIAVSPNSHIAIDMKIPWAAASTDFPGKHLELQVNGFTRYWIWQATQSDGDFIRFSTDTGWHNPGDHVYGYAGSATNFVEAFATIGATYEDWAQYVLTDRTLVVLDSHFETIPIHPKPFGPASTFIKRLENHTTVPVTLFSAESKQTISVGAGATVSLDMAVPWALGENDFFFPFRDHHLEVSLDGVKRFWVWQHDNPNDGDYVRVSTNGTWSPFNNRVAGFAETGECPGDLVFTNGRTLIVSNSEIKLAPNPLILDQLFNKVQPFLHAAHRQSENPLTNIPSIAKRSAVGFSMAGPVSDAWLRGDHDTRFTYKETGKRYEFALGSDGRVTATHPDGTKTLLDKARSFTVLRKGEENLTPPPFDLIAANGGRVFAKAANKDEFYFATMDHLFIHWDPDQQREISLPGTYFKLDPEFAQPGQNVLDLLETTKDIKRFDHPASDRLPVFQRVLLRQLSDMMIADIEPRVWQRLDCRPPQNVMALAIRDLTPAGAAAFVAIFALAPPIGVALAIASIVYTLIEGETPLQSMFNLPNTGSAPPTDPRVQPPVPTYTPITYVRDGDESHPIQPPAIKFDKVLDIGVGSVHLHQQYQRIVGCEMQAMIDVPVYAQLYRFFNGPLTDGDGYCDGTINYYALVRHDNDINNDSDNTFRLLFQDEQSYFSQRWRMVSPDDNAGATFSLLGDLNQPAYHWDRETYWSPFDAPQHINDQSRLAVAAQVLLVTGKDPATNTWKIYINSSWGTMDRTWRWRDLPKDPVTGPATVSFFGQTDVDAGNEPIAASGTTVYPQTIRLRDDMTINLKGTRNNIVGRWYQRYLPPDNNLVPPKEGLVTGRHMPADGYKHPWKFISESAFQLADKFQFFGAYDANIDTRTQYYDVTVPAAEIPKLVAWSGPWIDDTQQLWVSQWKFKWNDADRLGAAPIVTPSTFNPDTRLRIEKKGSRWIATFWDKRDDDIIKFERLPRTVTLKKSTDPNTTVQITIGEYHLLRDTPLVKTAYFWLEPNGMAGVAFEGTSFDVVSENVSKVRMASLTEVAAPVPGDPNRVLPRVNPFLNQPAEGSFTPIIGPGTFEFRWTPSAADKALLQQHGTPDGEAQFATSIWFEDIIGNVAPPERIIWQRSPRAKAVATPSVIPLGVPTQVTVHASDSRTDGSISGGTVWVDGKAVGTTDAPFTFTFNTHTVIEIEGDPPSRITTVVEPVMTVTLPSYPEVLVPVQFFTPKLVIRLEPASLPIGPTVQVVVRVEDETTHVPVQGRVIIGGVDVGATNTPFNFAFNSSNTSGEVRATGYPNKTFAIPLFAPTMQVSVSPSPIPTGVPVQVTVRAVDSRTGLPVNGRVKFGGVDTAATNTPFMFTFGLTPPAGVVSVPFYPDVAITWPPISISTLTTDIMPMPVPINKTFQCTVTAKNAQTGALIAGRVRINGLDVAATNTPFSTIMRPKAMGAEGELFMPEVSVTAFGYRETLVNTGF